MSATGTTPSTIVTLETSSAPMLAWLKALTKLPHCGSAGHSMPSGIDPDGCRAVVKRLMNGRIVIAISTISEPATEPQLAAAATLTSRTPGRAAGWAGS